MIYHHTLDGSKLKGELRKDHVKGEAHDMNGSNASMGYEMNIQELKCFVFDCHFPALKRLVDLK